MIVNLSLFFISLTRVLKNNSEKNIERVKYYSKKCGPLAIKLLQFISNVSNFLLVNSFFCEDQVKIFTFANDCCLYDFIEFLIGFHKGL